MLFTDAHNMHIIVAHLKQHNTLSDKTRESQFGMAIKTF